MKKAYILGFIAGLVLLTVGGVAGSILQKKNAEQRKQELALAKYREEVVDATPVQLGVLTDKQRIHSRIYTHYQQVRGGESISGLVANANGKSKIVETIIHPPLMPEFPNSQTPEYYFGKLANRSDAIIRGRVTKKTSQITEDDSFIFTDYDVEIIEVLKNNVTAPIESGATITITRPGGKVLLDGVIVKAAESSFAPLRVNKEVVVFLKFIPETETYQATEATGSFELDGSSLRPLTERAFPRGVLQTRDSFLHSLRVISKE